MNRIQLSLLFLAVCSGLSQALGSPHKSHKSAPRKVVAPKSRTVSQCTPMSETFSSSGLPPSWVQLSTNPQAHKMNPGGGVNLALNPPVGPVLQSANGKTNDKLGDGSTLNSTYSFLYGKVSLTLAASDVPGAVVALVLFGTTTADEIDIEILGGDAKHWQTNVFRPAPGETEPLYGVFGGVHDYANGGTTGGIHTYTVDWSPSGITWSVDGRPVRTLTPDQTLHNGQRHYPSARSRIQLGLWDASSPEGTSDWAHGPVPWAKRQRKPVTALIKSIKVECPY
ncbi:hypothetical protein PGT21_032549 [Puccinia graminis f. sp. tritici]|uniref:GH16 domain-containing protein n=2 Tax=Puccinia graminis f. sp. tritici TaxID=56615 RepID=E3L460_PUCGT|nr:uncharacterized protein PGTG_16989 [Puccinia graminis f. sp. tritici CRL 75-36-700-3]EFP91335.1 hypothetical protein PGTG_16989 [Puccinia graminis f. sp. tritici CRL 75-36-700-3]KAA1113492.1 hypothetical protein PGT21_032549 [Puccinia graminis f. sp. tritici]KAA1130809.1 hypothetical protein PGTUg99_022407 [Puccinia graminis f. sp. tritici]